MMKKVPYDPITDFTPVTRMGSFTLMLVMHPSIPAKNVKELIAYAKANPGKLSFASANTSGIVAGETLKRWAGIDILHGPASRRLRLRGCRHRGEHRGERAELQKFPRRITHLNPPVGVLEPRLYPALAFAQPQ